MDSEQVENLIAQENWTELKSLLQTELAAELTPEERGAVYVNVMRVYLDVTSRLNREYSQEMQTIIDSLQKVGRAEQTAMDDVDLAAARSKLQ